MEKVAEQIKSEIVFDVPNSESSNMKLLLNALIVMIFLMSPNAKASNAESIHESLVSFAAKAVGYPIPSTTLLIKADSEPWATDRKSFAFEKTEADGAAEIFALSSWVGKASDDEAGFVLAHEMAHAICGHAFKSYGLYSLYTKAKGLDIKLLSEGANSDQAFQFMATDAFESMESEADLLGAVLARSLGYDSGLGAELAVGSSHASLGHPDGALRVLAIKEGIARGQSLRSLIQQCQMRAPSSY